MSLKSLQNSFKKAAISQNTEGFLEAHLPYEKKEAQERFSIYQNNIMASLSSVLATTFPACEKLVGEDFFRHKAYGFIKNNLPQKAVLFEYGAGFIEYFEAVGRENNYGYWGEVAAFEWAEHSCYYGADAQTLSLQDLVAFDESTFGELVVRLAPAIRLLETTYNVQEIVEVVKGPLDEEDGNITDMKEGFEISKTHDFYVFYPMESKGSVDKVSSFVFKALVALQKAPCSFESLAAMFAEQENETVFAGFITLLFDKKLLIRM